MKKLITSFLLISICCLFMQAQTNEDYYVPDTKKTERNKVSATITAGTGFGFMNSSKNAVMSTFVAPQIGYKLSSKWSLNIAMMHSAVSVNPSFMNANDNRYLNSNQTNFNAAALGFEYKISNKASIGISTTIGKGNSNFINPAGSSFSNSMYPFGMFSPFGR